MQSGFDVDLVATDERPHRGFAQEDILPSALQFGDFRLDCGRFELCLKGHPVRVERKPMELLILLRASNRVFSVALRMSLRTPNAH
jgi:DNA-binding response OmpR family regulator